MIPANGHNTEQSNDDQSNSERVKCSYLIKYSNPNNDDQKQTAIPILIPAAKPSGSKIHIDRSYMPECSCCNIKIDLEDAGFHKTHIKNPDVQKLCVENATHLNVPNSCLCNRCYQATKKRTSTKNYTRRACIIMACEQIACHTFNSKLIDILKSSLLINKDHKINFRVQTNGEESLHKTSFCNAHYDQLMLITQCQLCGNKSLQKFKLRENLVHEYQRILDEDNIPATLKYGILICKPCHIYILLRRYKTKIIPSELKKHCDATKTRITNNNKLKTKELENMKLAKYEINMGKKEENKKLLTVTSLPTKRSNIVSAYSSIPSKSVTTGFAVDDSIKPPPSVNSTPEAASMQSLTTVTTTGVETALATEVMTTNTKPIVETLVTSALTEVTKNVKLTEATGKSTVLIFKRKRTPTFLNEHSPVPKAKKRVVKRLTVTNGCIKHTMSDREPTIPIHNPSVQVVKTTTPVEKPTTSVDIPTISIHKPLYNKSLVFSPVLRPIFSSKWPVPEKQLFQNLKVPVEKPTTSVDIPTISIHKPLYNKSLVFSPVLRPIFSSKWPVPEKQLFQNLKVPVKKPTTPVNKPTISIHKPLYNKSLVFSSVLRPYFSSKCPLPKKRQKIPESISPINKPTKLQMNQSHQNTLDSRSTSLQYEIPKLSLHECEPSILSSTTSDMNEFENLKVPIEKPIIPVDKPTIDDHTLINNKSPIGLPVLRTFRPKCTELKKYENPLESVSPMIEPTQLQTNQSHHNMLDSRATSLQTEIPELSLHEFEPSILSSTTSNMNEFENLKVPIKKPTIADRECLDNNSPVFSPILSPLFSSKCTVLKEYEKRPESVSSIKNPTQPQTNQSHQNTLEPQSTSPRTEFHKLSHQRTGPTTMSSATPNIIQLFENLKSIYPSGMEFVNHLLNLETCRNLGSLTLRKNKTTIRQRTSNTVTTPSHNIHCPPEQKEYQTVSCTDDDDNDLTNFDYLSDECVPSDDNSSNSHFIPVKTNSKSNNIPKQKSKLPKSFVNKPFQYQDSGDNNPDITIAASTSTVIMSITTTEATTNIVSATSPVFTTIAKAIKASEVPDTVEMAAVVTNTSALNTAITDSIKSIADSTKAIKNIEVPVITDTVTINYDKSDIIVNENTTVADTAAVDKSVTLYNNDALTIITNVASIKANAKVPAAIDDDSVTAAPTIVTDDITSVKINTESSTITNAITTESSKSANCVDTCPTINASTITSDIITTTETIIETSITASKISNDSDLTSNENTIPLFLQYKAFLPKAPC